MTPTTRMLVSGGVLLLASVIVSFQLAGDSQTSDMGNSPKAWPITGIESGTDYGATQKEERGSGDTVRTNHDNEEKQDWNEIRSLGSQVRLLKADLIDLRNEVKRLQQGDLHNAIAGYPDTRGPNDVQSSDELMASRADAAARTDEDMEMTEMAFLQESKDPTWSAQTSSAIHQALETDELAGTDVSTVECRSTLCKVEVTLNDPQKFTDFMLWLPRLLAEILPTFTMKEVDEGEGVTTHIYYFASSGESVSEP